MASPWIKFRSNTPAPQLTLFCFPHAGGTATAYRTWARHFPDTVEFCPIEYPGHGTRRAEPLRHDLSDLVEALVEGLAEELHRPFAFYGHSLGALVAFEACRKLAKTGEQKAKHLFVSGRRAPQLQPPHTDMHTMDDATLVNAVMRDYGGIPAEVLEEPELLEMMMPMVRADLQMYETYTYQPGPPLPHGISCYAGRSDKMHPPAQLEPWQEQTNQRCTVTAFDGGHFFIQSARDAFLTALIQQIEELI